MIGFTAPWALAGLVLAGIPLLLHLVARREPPTLAFPAVRYLEEASRRHQRRLHLQHLLLLAVRTLLILCLVLAAAGPVRTGSAGLGAHAPAALVLVLDNSLSAGAVRDGRVTFDELREAAHGVLARASAADQLWLLAADGIPRGGSAELLRAHLDSLAVIPWRLDLGEAVATARSLLGTTSLPGEVVVLTDGQRTALGAAAPGAPLTVGIPAAPPPMNLGIHSLDTGPQPWLGAGRVVAHTAGDSGVGQRPLAIVLDGREARASLVAGEGTVAVPLQAPAPGWHALEARLDPDELRGDDVAVGAVRLSAPAAVTWSAAEPFLHAAAEVLAENGRIVRGSALTLGGLGPGASVVFPPADPAAVGALNRALRARGVTWALGDFVAAPGRTDSAGIAGGVSVARRHRLVPEGSGLSGVLATVDGEPWIVRTGEVVLVASRMDTAWTSLPLTAGYMPFMDALLNRHARGDLPSLAAVPGGRLHLPAGVTAVAAPGGVTPMESGGAWTPIVTGLHWLLVEADTVGVVAVNPDPRESLLEPATAREVAGLWGAARVVEADQVPNQVFRHAAQADLRGPLLWLAVLLGIAEFLLAGRMRGARS